MDANEINMAGFCFYYHRNIFMSDQLITFLILQMTLQNSKQKLIMRQNQKKGDVWSGRFCQTLCLPYLAGPLL